MSLSDREDELFESWPSRQEPFVRDGVVDADECVRSRVKLLFVLKEVNDLGGGGWDLREFLRAGGRAQTWNTVARWVEGIDRLLCIVPWTELFVDRRHSTKPRPAEGGRQSEVAAGRRGGGRRPIERGDATRPPVNQSAVVLV